MKLEKTQVSPKKLPNKTQKEITPNSDQPELQLKLDIKKFKKN